MDSGIAIAVRYEEVTGRPERQVGRVVERWAGSLDRPVIHACGSRVGGTTSVPQGEEQPAVAGERADGVATVVGTIHGIIGTDEDAVRPGKEILSPRHKQGTIRVENLHGAWSAEEDKHAVATVARHRHGLAGRPIGRKLRPTGLDAITKTAGADFKTCCYFR
jgi:hypothetical protein